MPRLYAEAFLFDKEISFRYARSSFGNTISRGGGCMKLLKRVGYAVLCLVMLAAIVVELTAAASPTQYRNLALREAAIDSRYVVFTTISDKRFTGDVRNVEVAVHPWLDGTYVDILAESDAFVVHDWAESATIYVRTYAEKKDYDAKFAQVRTEFYDHRDVRLEMPKSQ